MSALVTGSMMDIFLSYNFRDGEAVQVVGHALRQQGLSVFLDRWYLTPGLSWPQALEKALSHCRAVAVFIGPNGLGRWQQHEKNLALDMQSRNPAFPVIPVLLPGADPALGFLSLNTWVDLRGGLNDPDAYSILASAVRGEPPGPRVQARVTATLAMICPYRGLRPFREEDAAFFFGREPYIPKLVKAVDQHPFVAVVGASGSGKSSVVRSGLVPHVRRGIGTQIWDVVSLVPGVRPLHAMADALLPLIEPETFGVERLVKVNELAEHLTEGRVALSDVVAEALKSQPGTDRLLLVVDQWEELYTSVEDELSRRRFIDELLNATAAGRLSAVMTLRADFYGNVLSYRPLADRLQNNVVNLGPMNREELKRTIVEPADRVGLSFEPGLVERVLGDVEDEPGNLPLLEFALTELWACRRRGLLLNDAYNEIGGVAGAVARRADEVFSKFAPESQVIARYIFTRLVRVARPEEGMEDTRQRVILDELQSQRQPVDGRGVREVVKALADARLLVTSRDAATGKVTVEVAHEALIRKWRRLRDWIDEDRDGLRILNRLTNAAEEWQANDKKSLFLYHGAHLTEALDWAGRNHDKLSDDELLFLKSSHRRRRIIRASVVAGVCLVGLTAVIAIFLALRERELKIEVMRSTDELKLQSLLDELRGVWLDEAGMRRWMLKAGEFAEPVDRHAGRNPQFDQRLRHFRFDETGDMASARKCIERVRTLKERTIDEQKNKWDEVITSIANAKSIYGDLRPKPIEGLVPLGPDPQTRLQEFAVYLTGEVPARNGDGRLKLSRESAVVLVLIPAGSFDMGAENRDDAEAPVSKNLRLDVFLISKYEMTQAQWMMASFSSPSQLKDDGQVLAGMGKPVETISWSAAVEVLRRLHLTLPTEAQWEYAARARTTGDYFVGDGEAAVEAGCISQSRQKRVRTVPRDTTCDVTHGKANNFGLYGVIGNVWEWCLDMQCPYEEPPKPGTGERNCDSVPRVFRGGSFVSDPTLARVTMRRSNPPDFKSSNMGVRPAMRLEDWVAAQN